MGAFDKIVAAVSPRRACEREAWRQQLEILRGYDAAGYGRLNAGWRVHNESAEVTDRFSRDVVRARARDLERNSDIAQSILHAYKRNVVGKGYTLQAKTGNDELDEKLEKAWRQWCKARNCDVTGEQSFNQMLRMAVDRKKVDGGKYKDQIAARMRKPNGTGSWQVYKDCDMEYAEQVTAEHKVTERSGGKEVQKWVLKSSHADNHYLDCEVYAAAAADVMGVRSLYLKSVEGQAAAPEPRKPAKQEPRQSQEENWINQNDTWI